MSHHNLHLQLAAVIGGDADPYAAH
jgi:hypothetical protein